MMPCNVNKHDPTENTSMKPYWSTKGNAHDIDFLANANPQNKCWINE